MQALPIDPYLPRIVESLRSRPALVLVGPPGSGKTTRVPPAILEGVLRGKGKIVVLQPRRIAARAAAMRIAGERGWTLGREVGYTVRFENRAGPHTGIQIVTEGILTRRLQGDPFLEGVAAVVLDEFHERSIHADLALALVREIRKSARADLLVVVMSATLDPAPVSGFLGNCPIIEAEGRPYPVDIRYLDRVDRTEIRGARGLPELAARALREAWSESSGSALVFLPGIGEIRRAFRLLESFAGSQDAILVPLHGSLSLNEQQVALTPSERRKIILSTNIAETSLTVEGVDLVIDGGCARVLRNDPRHGIDRLEVERISKHSADQRAGRAGRLGPGRALRLWTRAEHSSLPEDDEPEIRRVDLASTVLELRAWGISHPAAFEWYEAPDPLRLERAEDLLVALGAVKEKHGPLTPRGKAMLEIPAHPRIARIIAEAHAKGALEAGATLAALLEEKDIVPISALPSAAGHGKGKEAGPSDLLVRCDLLSEVERGGFRRERGGAGEVDTSAAKAVARTRDVLLREARDALGPPDRGKSKGAGAARRRIPEETLLRILLCGYPDRVIRRRAKGSDRGVMTGGMGVVLSPGSVVRDATFFLALDLDEGHGERGEARVHLASAVRREWIEEDLAQFIAEQVETSFDPAAEKVRSTRTLCYLDLPLEEPRDHKPPPELAEKLLAAAVRDRAEAIAGASLPAVSWIARVRSLAAWMPELKLPRFDAAELGDILAGACAGKTSLAEVREADILGLLKSSIPHSKLRAVEEHAPEALRVPSGNKVRLSYEPPRPPVLAVRLQEMFGLAETPTVAAGRVPVLLHLLGPNFRPVQITQDLRSFWNTTYAQVRKDLRARYPKHAWPEDPWTAQPTSRRRK